MNYLCSLRIIIVITEGSSTESLFAWARTLYKYYSRCRHTEISPAQTTECPHPVLCHWSDPRCELRTSRPRCLIMCRIFLLCYLTLCIMIIWTSLSLFDHLIIRYRSETTQSQIDAKVDSRGLFKCTVWICVTSIVIGFPQTSADNSTNHKSGNVDDRGKRTPAAYVRV